MKVGDLVYWHDKKSLLGIVIEVTKPMDTWDVQGVRVQWANGVESSGYGVYRGKDATQL